MASRKKAEPEGMQSVAFAGGGDSSEANTKKLLDPWFDDDVENIFLPDRIVRGQNGLKNVVDWVENTFGGDGEGYITAPKKELVNRLITDQEAGHNPVLIFLPKDELDSVEEGLLTAAQEAGIRILDLTEGLDEIVVKDPEPEPDEKPARGRGKSRGTSRSAAAEEPDEAQVEAETSAPATGAALIGVSLVLYEAIRDQLVADGYLKAAKPRIFAAWCNEDGDYRPVVGKGRGRKGESRVELGEEEVRKIDGLWEQFEEIE
jgi:hypothetical protein